MNALIKLLGGVRGTIFFAAAVALAILVAVQVARINNLRGANKLLRDAVAGYAQAQQINLDNIGDLKERIDRMVEERRLDAEAASRATAELARKEQAAQAALARKQEELDNVYARNPQARAWGNTGVDAAVLDRLPNGGAR